MKTFDSYFWVIVIPYKEQFICMFWNHDKNELDFTYTSDICEAQHFDSVKEARAIATKFALNTRDHKIYQYHTETAVCDRQSI